MRILKMRHDCFLYMVAIILKDELNINLRLVFTGSSSLPVVLSMIIFYIIP